MKKSCILCGKSISYRELPLELSGGHILCRDCDNNIIYDLKKIYKSMPKDEFKKIRTKIIDYAKDRYQKNILDIIVATIDDTYLVSSGEHRSFKKTNGNVGPFESQDLVYSIEGVRGRHIDIYIDKVVITTKVTLGSLLTHNATDGEKTIYYSDCIGVQFKESKFAIGYLQLETASSNGNNKYSNFFAENSFTFDETVISNEKMIEVADYVKSRVDTVKKGGIAPASNNNNMSVADELLKLKQLLDMGILSQEEFDEQKNKLLNK